MSNLFAAFFFSLHAKLINKQSGKPSEALKLVGNPFAECPWLKMLMPPLKCRIRASLSLFCKDFCKIRRFLEFFNKKSLKHLEVY